MQSDSSTIFNEFCVLRSVYVLLKVSLFIFFLLFDCILHFYLWYFVSSFYQMEILHWKSVPKFVRDWSKLIVNIKTVFHNFLPMQKLEPGQLSFIVSWVGDGQCGAWLLTGARDISCFLVQNSSGTHFSSIGTRVSLCG
jgi:hypothetical protein